MRPLLKAKVEEDREGCRLERLRNQEKRRLSSGRDIEQTEQERRSDDGLGEQGAEHQDETEGLSRIRSRSSQCDSIAGDGKYTWPYRGPDVTTTWFFRSTRRW